MDSNLSRETSHLSQPDPPGMMLGGTNNSYGPGMQHNPVMMPSSSGIMQPGMRLFNTGTSSPPSRPSDPPSTMLYSGDGQVGLRPCGGISMSDPIKKKRGRPRKYGPDGSMSLNLMPPSSPSGHSIQTSEQTVKKRGRPLGSGKKHQLDAFGSTKTSFIPHIITVNAGEDVASKIMGFSQQGSWTVCILSANGVICNVSLRQPAISGGTVTYEGCFEIISLSGSFLFTEEGGTRSRTGGLSVTLADSDGRVLGGGVAGMLVAATPVQVVLGSFNADQKRSKPSTEKHDVPMAPPPQISSGLGGGFNTSSPPSQGTVSESSDDGDTGSPLNNQSGGNRHNSGQHHVSNMSPYTSLGWPQVSPSLNNLHRHETDMKMMPN